MRGWRLPAGVLCLCGVAGAVAAAGQPVSFVLRDMKLPDFITFYYAKVLHRAFVLDPAVPASSATVTASVNGVAGSDLALLRSMLGQYGLAVEEGRFFDRIVPLRPVLQDLIYQPRFRDARYLMNAMAQLYGLKGRVTGRDFMEDARVPGAATVAPAPVPATAPAMPPSAEGIDRTAEAAQADSENGSEMLLFRGDEATLARIRSAIERLDVPVRQIRVRMIVYEVSDSGKDGFDLVGVLQGLASRLRLSLGPAGGPDAASGSGGSIFRFTNTNIDLFARIFAAQGAFRIVTRPEILAASGKVTRFQSGETVPVLGALTYDANRNPVQSVLYMPSGVLIEVRPVIHADTVSISLRQEVSSFTETTTGVNATPTLVTRNLSSTFYARPGDTYVIAGLKTASESRNDSFMPFTGWRLSRADSRAGSEIVLFFQCEMA